MGTTASRRGARTLADTGYGDREYIKPGELAQRPHPFAIVAAREKTHDFADGKGPQALIEFDLEWLDGPAKGARNTLTLATSTLRAELAGNIDKHGAVGPCRLKQGRKPKTAGRSAPWVFVDAADFLWDGETVGGVSAAGLGAGYDSQEDADALGSEDDDLPF